MAGVFVLGHHDRVRKHGAHGHPGLLAGQNVGAVGLLLGDAGHRTVVGTGARLGDGQRGDGPAGLHVVVHGLLLLLVGAELHDVEHRQGVLVEDMHAAGLLVQALDHEADGQTVGRDSAVLFGDAHEAETGIAVSFGDLVGHAALFVHLGDDVVGEVALAELVNALQQKLLLVGQIKVHISSSITRSGPFWPCTSLSMR